MQQLVIEAVCAKGEDIDPLLPVFLLTIYKTHQTRRNRFGAKSNVPCAQFDFKRQGFLLVLVSIDARA